MKLVLTRKGDNKEIVVESDSVKLMETDADGVSTHIVFGADLVRVVNESVASIAAVTGVAAPQPTPLPLSQIAKIPAKKKK